MSRRLTIADRDAFVRRVMQDVPKVDYEQQMTDLILADAVAQLPPKVRAVWDDTATRGFLDTSSYWDTRQLVPSVMVPFPSRRDWQLSDLASVVLDKLNAAAEAQKRTLDDLRSKLRGVAASVTTVKALRTALPEFEKYMPVDEAATSRTVPAIANVVSDFVRAGWPKDKQLVAA